MGLKILYHLLDQGKIAEALLEVKTLQGDERIEGELVKTLYQLVFYGEGGKQVTSYTKQVLAKNQENPRIQSFTRIARAFGFLWQAKYEEGRIELEIAQNLLNTLPKNEQAESRHFQALLWILNGYYYLAQGKDDLGLDMFSQSLRIATQEEFPLKSLAADNYNDIGVIYERRGEWSRAIECHTKGLAIGRKLGNEMIQVNPLLKLGSIYHMQGDLDLALEYNQKGFDLSQLNNHKLGITRGLSGIGSIYHSKGEFQYALDYYQKSLALTKDIKLETFTDLSITLYRLCLLHLDLQAHEQAQVYLTQLQEHSKSNTSPTTQIFCLLAEALILKTRKRFREKAQAQDLLREILENKNTSQRIRFLVTLHLCDLLLQEVKMFGDDALLQEVQAVVKQVIDLTHTWKFIPDLINALVLQAKFSLIQDDTRNAMKILEKAHKTAEEKGLTHLIVKVKTEQSILKQELKKWQELADKNASLQERFAFAEIEEYLQEAIKIRNITPEKWD